MGLFKKFLLARFFYPFVFFRFVFEFLLALCATENIFSSIARERVLSIRFNLSTTDWICLTFIKHDKAPFQPINAVDCF